VGLLRTLFLGDIGNYLDNEDLKDDHERTRKRLLRKEYKDQEQDKLINDLDRENIQLKYALSALVKILHRKDVLSIEDLEDISEIESNIEAGVDDHGTLWKKFNKEA
jgi:hypothetical protein